MAAVKNKKRGKGKGKAPATPAAKGSAKLSKKTKEKHLSMTPEDIKRIVDEVAGRPPVKPGEKEVISTATGKKVRSPAGSAAKKKLDMSPEKPDSSTISASAHGTELEPISPASLVLPPELNALTMQELIFCEEFLVLANGGAAAQKAGYAPDNLQSASMQAGRLLKRVDIQGYMRARKASMVRSRGITIDTLVDMLLETYGKAQTAVPVLEFDHASKSMVETGLYTFDGRTAVASVLAIARLKGYDKGKDDGRKQRPFNIAIILGKYDRAGAAKVIEHAEIAAPSPDATPSVPGFPRVRFKKPSMPGGKHDDGDERP